MNAEYMKLLLKKPELFRNSEEKESIRIITDPEEIKKIERDLGKEAGILFENEYIMLIRDVVISPDESKGTYIRIIPQEDKNAVVVLPVSAGKILLMRHYRHSLRESLWEIPRGFGEYGLTREQNAAKELREETGISDVEFVFLGKVCSDSGLSSASASVYLAKTASIYEFKKLDKIETIDEYRLVSQEELKKLACAGELKDGFTLSAIALAWLSGKLET